MMVQVRNVDTSDRSLLQVPALIEERGESVEYCAPIEWYIRPLCIWIERFLRPVCTHC